MKALAIAVAMMSTLMPTHCQGQTTCPEFEPMLEEYAPQAGWDINRMSHIMWRESRCNPEAYNAYGRASGLLQITPIGYPYIRQELGEWVDRWTLTDPIQNVRASAVLYDYWVSHGHSGYQPWVL